MPSQFNADSAVFQLDLDARKFHSATKKAQESFAKFADKTGEKIQTVRQQFSNYLINDLAGNTIKRAFESSLKYVADFAEKSKELVKIADATNVSVEALSKLQAVANETDLDLQALADAANSLNFAALADSADELGLSLEQVRQKDAAEAFAEVIDALNALPDAEKRAEKGAALFGDSFDALAPILDGTTDSLRDAIEAAKEAGLVTTDEAARAAAEFADSLTKLKGVATALANVLVSACLPVLQEMGENLTTAVKYVQNLIEPTAEADAQFNALARSTQKAREQFEKLRQEDAAKLSFVEDLAGQGELTAETFEKAASYVDLLQERYGDLGLTVDAATKSIEAAADAQRRFNEAAKQKERDALQKELDAALENKKALDEKASREMQAADGWIGGTKTAAREVFSKASFGLVDSAVENRTKKMEEIGNAAYEEQKRINELRKKLEALDQKTTETPTVPTSENPASESFPAKETPASESFPAKENPKTNSGSSFSTKGDRLDAEITQFETRVAREARTADQNAIADVRAQEADYRAKIDARIVEERSKGKSNQDAALIETFLQKREESTKREEERVQKIKAEIDDALAETDWNKATNPDEPSLLPTPAQEDDEDQTELLKRYDAIQKEADEYKKLLEKGIELSETPEEREKWEAKLAELPQKIAERKDDALEEFNSEKEAERLEALQKAFEADGFPEGMQADPDFWKEAFNVAEETAKGTAATFSAYDAANIAQAGLEEQALKEAQRQTRILENLYRVCRSNQAAFA